MASLSVPTRRSTRRSLAAMVTCALVAASVPAATSPSAATATSASTSSAAAGEAELTSGGFALAGNDSSGNACTDTGNRLSDDAQLPRGGGFRATRFSSTPTITGEPGDVSRFSLSSSARASTTITRGLLSRFSFSAQVAASGEFARGADTECIILADASSRVSGTVTVPSGFLSIRLVVTGGADGSAAFEEVILDGRGLYASTPTRTSATFFVERGDYELRLSAAARLLAPESASSPTSARGRVEAVGSFVPLGGATGKARGDGRRFVGFAQRRDCGPNTLRAAVTGRAARAADIRRIVYTVNGSRAGRLVNPRSGRAVLLRKPRPGRAARVKATVTLKNGARRTVTRSYVACTG